MTSPLDVPVMGVGAGSAISRAVETVSHGTFFIFLEVLSWG